MVGAFLRIGIEEREEEDFMEIRKATIDDLALVSAVEAECFPPAEAATKDSFRERLTYYGNHFWLLFEKGKLISFADGMVTNLADLTDEMYEKADMHDEHGAWQMIFGLNTVPACRKKGYAGLVLRRAIHDAEKSCPHLQERTDSLLWQVRFS